MYSNRSFLTLAFENTVDQDQMASEEAIWSGSTLFFIQFMNLYETNNIELSDWLTVGNGCGRLNLFSRIRVNCQQCITEDGFFVVVLFLFLMILFHIYQVFIWLSHYCHRMPWLISRLFGYNFCHLATTDLVPE